MYVPSIIVVFMTDGIEDNLLCVLALTNAKIEIEVSIGGNAFNELAIRKCQSKLICFGWQIN